MVAAFSTLSLYAQNESDALRYSQTAPAGTARTLGMGGAFSAVGGDMAAGASNPAGLGVFRRSVFQYSPNFRMANTTSDYLGNSGTGNTSGVGMSSWGFAFNTCSNGKKRALRSLTIGIGQNQLANYQRDVNASGYNTQSSITDFFANQANSSGIADQNTLAYAAYNTYLINPVADQGGGRYFGAVQNGNDPTRTLPNGDPHVRGTQQNIAQYEKGRNNEWFFGAGANISDILFVGATVGMQSLSYGRTFDYSEKDINNTHNYYVDSVSNSGGYPLEFNFNSMTYNETLSATGTGVNMKVGAILMPAKFFRIGASIQTPTMFSMNEKYSYQLTNDASSYSGSLGTLDTTISGVYDYRLTAPYKATLGAMLLFGKLGFLSADVEMTDYSTASFKSNYNDQPFVTANKNIQNLFQPVTNYRLGAEVRFDQLRLRAGYAQYGTPFTATGNTYLQADGSKPVLNTASQFITGGIGMKTDKFFLDMAYVQRVQNDKFRPYALSDTQFSPTIVNATQRSTVTMTIGFALGDGSSSNGNNDN